MAPQRTIKPHELPTTKGYFSSYYVLLVSQLQLGSMSSSSWQPDLMNVPHLRHTYSLGRGERERIEPHDGSSKLLLCSGMSFLHIFYWPK